jgi:hypothetical protein
MNLLNSLLTNRKNNRPSLRKTNLALELLENRWVPSAVSSIAGSFNGTAIPAGDTIWFDAGFTAGGLPKGAAVTLHVVNASINFTANGTAYSYSVPDTDVVLTPGATSATASFDASDGGWDVSAPSGGGGNVFMGGVAVPVTTALPGGIKNVSWTASFWSDTAGVTVNWHWGAAVYSNFGPSYLDIGVKPVDNNNLSVYLNGDHAGTPEAFKSFVVAGGTGGGGNNYTGNFTPNKGVSPSFGDGANIYPYVSSNPLTSVAFNESSVLVASKLDVANGTFDVWYSDEHALALGISQVNVKTTAGTTTTNYPLSAMTSNPGSVLYPAVGSTATTGDQAGTDVSGRPMYPSLFITDITNNPASQSGDWQWGGTAYAPSAVFGTWKGFVKTVDYTTGSPAVSVAAAADPAQNGWNLGAGADAPPAGLGNQGYGAEIRWNLKDLYAAGILIPGHNYRFYVIVHDGDQNKVGGDAGQAAYSVNLPPPPPVIQPASVSGFATNVATHAPFAGVTITLTGTDFNGNKVTLTTTTAADGSYSFTGLAPGTYNLAATIPPGYVDNGDMLGTVNGQTDGTQDPSQPAVLSSINLNSGDNGINYDFGFFVQQA